MAGDLQEFRSYGMAISLLLCYHMVEIGCRKEEAADFMDPKAYSPSTFKVLTYIQNHNHIVIPEKLSMPIVERSYNHA